MLFCEHGPVSFGVVYISLWVLFINNSETDDLHLASVRPREGSTVEADCILGLYPHDQQNWTNKQNKQTNKQQKTKNTPNTQLRLCFKLFGFLVPKCPMQILVVPDPREKVHPQRRRLKEPIPNSLGSLLWGSLCWEAYPYLISFSILCLKKFLALYLYSKNIRIL